MLVQLWAEEDRTPPWEGELDLTDAETGGAPESISDQWRAERYTAGLRRVRAGSRFALRSRWPLRGMTAAMSASSTSDRALEEADFRPPGCSHGERIE